MASSRKNLQRPIIFISETIHYDAYTERNNLDKGQKYQMMGYNPVHAVTEGKRIHQHS